MTGHGAKPNGPGFTLRIEEAPERTGIVTGDDGFAGRQDVNQLRVAVINDVEDIEMGPATGLQRIRDHPIQQAIGIAQCTVVDERRLDAGSGGNPLQQHIGNQFHAGPVLFRVIAEDGNARRVHFRICSNRASRRSTWVFRSKRPTLAIAARERLAR